MFLHYLVNVEMLVRHVLSLNCNSNKHQNLFHLDYGLQIRQI